MRKEGEGEGGKERERDKGGRAHAVIQSYCAQYTAIGFAYIPVPGLGCHVVHALYECQPQCSPEWPVCMPE